MDKERKGGIIVKICCVLAAIVLWLYISNTQNPLITYTIKKVPVEVKNEDMLKGNKLVLIKDKEYYVDIKIQGKASDVYRIKNSEFKVVADLSGYVVKKGENRLPIQVQKMPPNVSIVNSGDLWVKVNIDETIDKVVPVRIKVNGSSSDGSFIKEIITTPKDVKVSGPSKQVVLVERAEGEVNINNISNANTARVKLKAVNALGKEVKEIVIEPTTAHVALGVNLTKEVPIKLQTKGTIKDNLKIKSIDLSKSKVKIIGEESVIKNISYINTETIDISSISKSTEKQVELSLPIGIDILDSVKIINVNIQVESKSVETNNTQTNKNVEKEFSSKINLVNINKDLIATISNDTISFKVSGNKDIVNNLKSSDFNVNVDLSNIKAEGSYSVKVKINIPKGINLISQKYEDVKVEVKKKTS